MIQNYPDYADVDNTILKLWNQGDNYITTAKILIELGKDPKAGHYEKDWRQITVYNMNRWKRKNK